MTAKIFPLAAVLSVATGKLLCPYAEVRTLLIYLAGGSQHQQFARAMERSRPWLLRWFPALKAVAIDTLTTLQDLHGPEAGCQTFLANLRAAGYPATYEIAPIPPHPPLEETPHAHP